MKTNSKERYHVELPSELKTVINEAWELVKDELIVYHYHMMKNTKADTAQIGNELAVKFECDFDDVLIRSLSPIRIGFENAHRHDSKDLAEYDGMTTKVVAGRFSEKAPRVPKTTSELLTLAVAKSTDDSALEAQLQAMLTELKAKNG